LKIQTVKILISCVFIQLIFFSCKNAEVINLEAAIDEYLYLEKQEPLNMNNIENLKSKFEKINPEDINDEEKVSRLYYLSEIALMQDKVDEAHTFISKAYSMNHADSIYQQKEKINTITDDLKIDSTNTNIIWFSDANDKLLMFDFNKTDYSSNTAQKKDYSNSQINEIMNKGREEVQTLYNNKKYEAAINKAQMLIMIVNELNDNKILNTELSQLYQDLSILYAKQNLLDMAKETIEKAIALDPNDKNKEIQALLK
jgi:tetratricopeptide (TPR) repeat protein